VDDQPDITAVPAVTVWYHSLLHQYCVCSSGGHLVYHVGKVYEAFDWAYGDPVIHRDDNDVAAVAIGDTL
jgi:hypothetical protein